MSSDETEIVCRRCREVIPLEVDACPHCGAGIRSSLGPMVGLALGVLTALGAGLAGELPLAVVGIVVAVLTGFIVYEKRKRINEASESSGDSTGSFAADSTE